MGYHKIVLYSHFSVWHIFETLRSKDVSSCNLQKAVIQMFINSACHFQTVLFDIFVQTVNAYYTTLSSIKGNIFQMLIERAKGFVKKNKLFPLIVTQLYTEHII